MPPPVAPALPVEPTDHTQFLRSPRWKPWRSVVLIGAGVLALVALSTIALLLAWGYDLTTGRTTVDELTGQLEGGALRMTPAMFLANNVGLGLLIPATMLLTWAVTGQRPRWLSSVVGGLRWRWMLTVAAALAPIWLVMLALGLASSWRDLTPGPDTLVLAIGVLLTQPFQAAGEEYLFRGLFARGVGSFFRNSRVALAVAAIIPSLGFMLAHSAGDPWLNLFYLLFGLAAAWMTWRTGGLEAAIALHVVNNLTSASTLPFSDLTEVMDRSAGVIALTDVVPMLVPLVLGVVVVEVLTRWRRPVRLGPPPAPGAPAELGRQGLAT